MTPPDELDLTELENQVLQYWQGHTKVILAYAPADRVTATLEYLIARARFHNARRADRQNGSKPKLQPKQKRKS